MGVLGDVFDRSVMDSCGGGESHHGSYSDCLE